jgi:uncharacterized membrane protein (UPF0127 family)
MSGRTPLLTENIDDFESEQHGWRNIQSQSSPSWTGTVKSARMHLHSSRGQAFNQTRNIYLATDVTIADTHLTRLRGLLGRSAHDFRNGCGLWIRPCHGVHTLAMRFPIDVVYLDRAGTVVHVEHDLQPWRFSPVRMQAASVLELPSHTVARTETALGDRIEIRMKESS